MELHDCIYERRRAEMALRPLPESYRESHTEVALNCSVELRKSQWPSQQGVCGLRAGSSHHYMEISVVVTCGFLGCMIPTTEPSTGIQDGPEIGSG